MLAEEPDGPVKVVFSGDIGRFDVALHIDPDPLPACDTLLLESTYGNRDHDHRPLADQLREALVPALRRGGTVLIPAFAVARVQLITLVLRDLIESGMLPEVPIHIDSPMAVDVTRIYNRFLEGVDLDEDLPGASSRSLFPRGVRFHRTPQESKTLNALAGPRIIISSSGMLAGGRVLHHLRRVLVDPRNLILLAGFQAAGTRGRALEEGASTLRMHGMDIPVRAEVRSLHGFSAHADRTELLRWATDGPDRPRSVFLVHGEPDSLEALAQQIHHEGPETHIPELGQVFSRAASGRWVATEATA
jgi:metallo-beta-lactamase family protein